MKSAIFTGICLCLLFLSTSCSKSKFEDFNLLLISIDTVRADHLGCYGYSRGTSPTLDRLSREGILFTSHYSHAPTTAASHMTIFTSVYPSVHQIVNWDDMKESKENTSLSPQITTLAEILNNAGYNSISYNGGGNISRFLGFGRGYKIYRENAEREVLDWLLNPPEQPFFLFYHTYKPHDPYDPFKPLDKLFDPDYNGKLISSSDDMADVLDLSSPQANDDFHNVRDTFWSSIDYKNLDREIYHIKSLYDAEIFIADLFLNKILKRLKELELYKKTIIIFLSDHGEEFYEHNGFLHERLYREVLHVPYLINIPGIKPAIRTGVTRHIDVMPTILELFALKPPEYIQGKSIFNNLYKGKTEKVSVFSESQDLRISKALQLEEDYKFIFNQNSQTPTYPDLQPVELYDLQKDMCETENIIDRKKDDKITDSLFQKLDSYFEENKKLSKFSRGSKVEFDKETEDKLRSLGYIN